MLDYCVSNVDKTAKNHTQLDTIFLCESYSSFIIHCIFRLQFAAVTGQVSLQASIKHILLFIE